GQGDPAREEEDQAGRGDHLRLWAGIFRHLSQAERMQMRQVRGDTAQGASRGEGTMTLALPRLSPPDCALMRCACAAVPVAWCWQTRAIAVRSSFPPSRARRP